MFQQDDFFGGQSEEVKTAFNSALDMIQRLSRLKYTLSSNLIFDNLTASFNILREWVTAVDFKLSEEERTEIYEYENALKLDLPKAEETFIHDGKKYYRNAQLRDDVKEREIELARVLGRIEYRVGLGMVDKDDPRFALSQG